MINFVICEDEKVLAKEYKDEIDKFMMKYDFDYKCHYFSGYDKEFTAFATENKEFKIYLLDIKTKEGSGLDAARMIREELEDWSSILIILTAFNEYKYDAFSKRLMLLDYITKADNYKNCLHDCLDRSIKYYSTKPNTLRYGYKNEVYSIDFKRIVYVAKDQNVKRCIIHTEDHQQFIYQGSIRKLMEIFDKRFIRIARSTIVNTEHICAYNAKTNSIMFDTGHTTNDISRDSKRSIIEHVRGLK